MKKNKILYSVIIILVLIITICIYFYNNRNFIKINYSEIIDKVNNKDSFILCVTATDCIHCEQFKPKLKKISNKYNIQIFFTDVSTYSDDEYSEFKSKFSFDGGTPVTILIKDGEEKTTATRIEGNVSNEKIISKLKKNGFINE